MSTIKKTGGDEIKRTALWASLSFAVPSVILAFIMAMCGITPFGDKTLITGPGSAWFDSFSGMYESVISGEGVFYHLNVGFGSSFYSEFASGLCSPFMFFALFFGNRHLAAAYSFITIVRAGAAGAAAWYMLRQCTGIGRSMSFALSCGYSLCGFTAFAAYYPSIADGAVFFPLLAAGIYNYVQASRPVRLFVFGTAFFLTCPRLTLLGVVMSSVLYSAFYLRKASRKQRVYKSAMFAATLICSAAANAVLTIPLLAGSVNYKNGVFSEMKANDILSDLCFGGYGTTPSGGFGLCLAGLLIVGFFAFFFNSRIRTGEKVSIAAGTAVILICHAAAPVARFVLSFANARGESVNAGFMLALLAVYCTARNYSEREGIGTVGIACSAVLYGLLAAVSAAFAGQEVFALLAESGLAILAVAVFVRLCMKEGENAVRLSVLTAAAIALFGAVHCAGAAVSVHSPVTAGELSYVALNRAKAKDALEKSYLDKNEEVPRFYRTRSTDGISDSVDINRNEVEGLTRFAEKLGIMRGSEYGGADNFTEFTDILFGIANPDYGYYSEDDILYTACSPAYLIGSRDDRLPENLNAFELQNDLANRWFGVLPFEKAEPTERTSELSSRSARYRWTFGNETTAVDHYVIRAENGRSVYLLVPEGDYRFAVDGDSRSEWRKGCPGGIYNISLMHRQDDSDQGGEVLIHVYISSDVSQGTPEPEFWIYSGGLNDAVIPRCAEYISYRDSTVKFLFDVTQSQTAITSIPYDSGWEINVNGKSAEPIRLCGGLIGIQLEQGKNSVVMNYTPPYFKVSFWISAVLFVLGLYITLKVEHEAARRRKVRMAFRAVELRISRMTVDQLDETEETAPEEKTGAESTAESGEEENTPETESEETNNEEV